MADTGRKAAEGAANFESSFLANFCRSVPIAEKPSALTPTGIIFDTLAIEDALSAEDGEIRLVRGHRVFEGEMAIRLLHRISYVFDIQGEDVKPATSISSDDTLGKVRLFKTSYRLKSSVLAKYECTVEGKEQSLETYVNREQHFSLVFNEPDYAYIDGRLFQDKKLLSGIDGILDIMEPVSGLASVSDEKDLDKYGFGTKGIFNLLEKSVSPKSILVCDDLNDEWADYIEFAHQEQPPRISFFHCKHSNATTGASSFHEVVGQAIKNLSRLHSTSDELQKKWDKEWSKTYTSTSPFPRLRVGEMDDFAPALEITLRSPRTVREVVLMVSFASKKKLKTNFDNLKKGKSKPHVVQLLWLLSGFVAGCKEHSVIPRIICQP